MCARALKIRLKHLEYSTMLFLNFFVKIKQEVSGGAVVGKAALFRATQQFRDQDPSFLAY